MKITLFVLFTLFISLHANEIQRIESMVQDISQLRSDYTQTETKLAECKSKLQNSKQLLAQYAKQEKIYLNKIHNLENQLKKYKDRVKVKEKVKSKNQIKSKICLNNQKTEDDNPFPTLKMKKQFSVPQEEIIFFKASSFRVNKEAKIYDGVDAKVIGTWEDRRSFTSNQREGKWIKITGYFVEKVWQPSQKEMWIKSCNVINRSKVSE